MEENNKSVDRLLFSITEDGETTTLDRTYVDCTDFGRIDWLVEEFKYFLKAMSFPEIMTDRIICLDNGDKVVNASGDVLVERDLKFK